MGSSKVFAGFSNSKNTFDIGLEVAQGYNTKVAMLGCRVSVSYGLTQSCNMASLSWCVMIYYKLVMTLTRGKLPRKKWHVPATPKGCWFRQVCEDACLCCLQLLLADTSES